MNINFLSLGTLNKFQNNIRVNSNFSTNPINFKGLNQDSVELSETAQLQKTITGLQEEYVNTTQEYYKTQQEYMRGKITEKELKSKLRQLTLKSSKLSYEIKLHHKTIDFLKDDNIQSRPNTAFLYDPRLSGKEKKEILSQHPEIKTIEQIAAECGKPKIGYENTLIHALHKIFVLDTLGNKRYIDTSNSKNIDNYNLLVEELKHKITIDELASKTQLDYGFIADAIRRHYIDVMEMPYLDEDKKCKISLISDNLLEKSDNFKLLIPTKSKYYKSIQTKPDDELLVPLAYLSKLGYGTPKQIYKAFKKGYFRGYETIKEQNGQKKINVQINIASNAAESNLELLKSQNKNYFTMKQLARALRVPPSEIAKAIINGEIEPVNEYIFSSPNGYSVGIDLNNPKNEEYALKLFFIEQTKEELAKTKTQNKEKNKTLFGLKSKIAWVLSPNTRETASELAQGDGYLASIIEKEARIKNQQLEPNAEAEEISEKTPQETLSEAEEIKLNQYFKNVWETAGTIEYKNACIKASEIVKIYNEKGLDAIEESEIKEIIKEYMQQD